ncbi:MAG: hypothetical protein CSA09_05540 [Candidatus Contendobacter odensis]|uniref:Uncharacterized protein n=1 Tax=Candidatus Contendibacter odensensis TaxID=1400860 RepID=A0A2G6PE19_9GAMM|nr:MAG: hypothetical protein CSA09_05540 [Candidatus Contendobacter odensis]
MKPGEKNEKIDFVQLEIKIEKLKTLFSKGELCAAEFRCLNCESKKCVWDLCLSTCAKKIQIKGDH